MSTNLKSIFMKYYFFTTYFLCLLLAAIPINTSGQQLERESTEKVQDDWLKALNGSKNLNSFYSENSGILLNDDMYIGIKEINKQILVLKKNVGKFDSYKILGKYQLQRVNQKFILGEYKTVSGDVYTSIIGWKYLDKWTKEFEVIYKNNDSFTLETELVDQARGNWERFANLHKPDLIVEEVNTNNGKYFNRGNLYTGKEIIKAYSYMANDSFKIKLESLKVLQLNNSMVFDIGTFDVGEKGQGLYVLIWKKEAGIWKLLIDFNF